MRRQQVEATDDPPRIARWLLIAGVVIGVVAMHLLGHPTGRTDPMPAMTGAQMSHAGTGDLIHAAMPTAETTKRHPAAKVPVTGGMDPMNVCLAILTATLLLLLLRRSVSRLSRADRLTQLGAVISELFSGLPPPRAPSRQDLSVLRL
jgi:putative Ca2+/H+ antiporter (TMEM165/GDT1 family)